MIKLLTLWLMLGLGIGGNDISKINSLKKAGEEAYKARNYELAAQKFSMLVDSMQVEDEGAIMNLAHCYARLNQKDDAQRHYQKLILSKDQQTKSIAYQQLGALSNDPKTLEKSLSFFKSALKADPSNEDARYNYELIKKKLDHQKDQNQDQNQDNQDQQENDENKEDQEKQDQEDQQQGDDQQQDQEGQENQENQEEQEQQQNQEDQEGKEGEEQQDQQQQEGEQGEEKDQQQQQQEGEQGDKSEQQEQSQQQEGEEGEEDKEGQNMSSTSQKLEEMNISEEKAQMILEALKNSEIQYIQQNRRKPTQKKDNGKPDW